MIPEKEAAGGCGQRECGNLKEAPTGLQAVEGQPKSPVEAVQGS